MKHNFIDKYIWLTTFLFCVLLSGTSCKDDVGLPMQTIELSDEAITAVSYTHLDQTVSLNNKSEIKVTLKENIELLDEVVVVGYGVQKKANLTGAVATVTQETLKDRPVANIGRALQGVIPNLNVTLSSGQPGAGASFNIRGTTSPNGGSPLVLVDGVESSLERDVYKRQVHS